MSDKYIIERGQRVTYQCGFRIRVIDKKTGEVVFKCDSDYELNDFLKNK